VPLGRVLVVDDEPGVRAVCRRGLSQIGYEVTEAISGQEAVSIARRESFDLLLVDIIMPGMNGLETFQALKALQPDLIGIVMTGYATVDNAIEAVNLGFSGFLLKPFKLRELEAAVQEALTKREREKDLARLETLAPLARLSATFTTMDVETVLQNVAQVALEETRCDAATILLFPDKEGESLCISSGQRIDCQQDLLSALAQDNLVQVFQKNQSLHPSVQAALKSADLSCLAVARLALPQRTIGLLCVGHMLPSSSGAEPGSFSSGDVEALKVLATQAAVMVSNAKLFRRMVEEERLRQVLQRYLSPRTVQAVLNGCATPGTLGESRMMTVLLADVRDFSTLVEQTELGYLVEVLHEYFSAAVEIITAQQGVVDELSGDEILASFDRATVQGSDALRAVKAGLQMLERVDELRVKWLQRGLPSFDIGIGISTGPVAIGSIGSGERMALVTAGRILNLAARSQALTRKLDARLIITQDTFEEVRDFVLYRDLGVVNLKGIAEPVGLYGVYGLKDE